MAKHSAKFNQPVVAIEDTTALPVIKEGLTKRQIAELAASSVDNVLEVGNVFHVAEAIAAMDEFVKAVRKDERFVFFVRDELIKHQGRLITPSGAKIEVCEAAVAYDYSHNAEWRELEEQIRNLQEKKKAVEERLRSVAPGGIGVDYETGEVIEGAFRKSKSTYRITLANK